MIITDEKLLRQKSESCSIEEGKQIIEQLKKELEWNNQYGKIKGMGLSAPQIGIFKRVIYLKSQRVPEEIGLINPVITEVYDQAMHTDEGCLSFPDIRITTQRYEGVTVIDDLYSQGIGFYEIEAFAIQHEIDHLDGILFMDRKFTGIRKEQDINRNDSCFCGSGKKYKKCCLR